MQRVDTTESLASKGKNGGRELNHFYWMWMGLYSTGGRVGRLEKRSPDLYN